MKDLSIHFVFTSVVFVKIKLMILIRLLSLIIDDHLNSTSRLTPPVRVLPTNWCQLAYAEADEGDYRTPFKFFRTSSFMEVVMEKVFDNEKDAAATLGISVLSLRLMLAAGCPYGDFEKYQTVVHSLAAVGEAFGVSERTAATWRKKGMPDSPESGYPLVTIAQWRRKVGLDNEDLLPDRGATGDLARARIPYYRYQMLEAGRRAALDIMDFYRQMDRNDEDLVKFAYAASLAKHFEDLRLSDEDIESTLKECWKLV